MKSKKFNILTYAGTKRVGRYIVKVYWGHKSSSLKKSEWQYKEFNQWQKKKNVVWGTTWTSERWFPPTLNLEKKIETAMIVCYNTDVTPGWDYFAEIERFDAKEILKTLLT